MKRLLAILLTALSVVAHAQQAPEDAQYIRHAGPFGEEHVQQKRLEQIAIGLRVQQNLRIASDRNEAQYAENRRKCQAALQVAERCGKFAGTFYCDAKGFQPIVPHLAVKPATLDNGGRFRMERCVQDATASNQ